MRFWNVFRSLLAGPSEADLVFSDRLYLRVGDGEIALVSLAFDNSLVKSLSLDEAKKIFRSIKRACDLRQIEEVKVAELSWRTDARLRSKWLERLVADRIVIGFDGPSGFVRELVRREVVIAAVAEFTKRFGLDESPA
jgi:hypothetical protein